LCNLFNLGKRQVSPGTRTVIEKFQFFAHLFFLARQYLPARQRERSQISEPSHSGNLPQNPSMLVQQYHIQT
jgi:hypothetical protein